MTCLKCGRTVPEDILLCSECLTAKKIPISNTPLALEEDILKQQIQKLSRFKRRSKRWLALFIVLFLLCAAALGGATYYVYKQYNRIIAQTSRINSLETALIEVKDELAQSNMLNDSLRDTVSRNQQFINAYEAYTNLTPDEVIDLPKQPVEP